MISVSKPVTVFKFGLMAAIALLIVINSAAIVNAAPALQWEKNFGDGGADTGYAVWQTSDGGYVIAGNQPDTNSDKLLLVKTDAAGNQQWSKIFGDSGKAYSVKQTRDGGYILVGYDGDYCVLYKTDASGNEQWHRQYTANANTNGWSVQETDDGGFIVAGDTYLISTGSAATSSPNWDVWILRTDSSGTESWTRTWGGSEDARLRSVDCTTDGGFIFGGTRSNVNDGDAAFSNKPYLVKTDASGNIQWETTYERDSWDDYTGYYVQQTFDGGYMLAGDHHSKAFLLKTTSGGIQIFNQDYSDLDTNAAYSAQQAWDGGYVLAGYTQQTTENQDASVLIIRTNGLGIETWKATVPAASAGKDDHAYGIIQNGDGYYLITGDTLTYTTTDSDRPDVYFFKLDKDMTPSPDSEVVSSNIPAVWDAGKAYSVTVTFKNHGTKPWTYQDNITMGYGGDAALFGVTNQSIRIGKVVRPNHEYSFTFTMTAPAMNGTYNPQIQMVWEGRQLFGAIDNKTVRVVNGTPNPNEPATAGTTVPAATAVPSSTVTSTPAATQAPTNAPAATEAPVSTPEKSGGLPCLSSVILPLLVVGTVTVGVYTRRNKGN